MSGAAWVVLLSVAVPLIGFLLWLLFDDSTVRIPPGSIGLLLVQGRATRKVLPPGRHLVLSIRKRSVVEYPSLQLVYRAGHGEGHVQPLERTGPVVAVVLGDRTDATVSFTVRFSLIADELSVLHERYGAEGLWSLTRDLTEAAVRDTLLDSSVSVDDLYGERRRALEGQLSGRVGAALLEHGIEVHLFALTESSTGRAGEVIAATARARLDLALEHAEATTRAARAANDRDLVEAFGTMSVDIPLRYREYEVWRHLMVTGDHEVVVRPPDPGRSPLEPAPEATGAAEAIEGRDVPPPNEAATR